MENNNIQEQIRSGQTTVGIELGSTRIKAVLIGQDFTPLASGAFDWENSQKNGIWTYSLEEVWSGIQACYGSLRNDSMNKYGIIPERLKSIGISGMMHGYLVFDKDGTQLTPFRTWRNNITGASSKELTELFQYPIPQRWSIAHLYQAVLNDEPHAGSISSMTTLAGYVHQKLTGENVIGVGEASGMFPINIDRKDYDLQMMESFDKLLSPRGFSWRIMDILPKTKSAGETAGKLTPRGALLLDPTGNLEAGIPLCPPEGDAGTGMVATNSVKVRTGNVSAGTSVFAMLVLEKELKKVHPEIDQVTTPDGSLVAMAHSNNCSSEYSAWINLFGDAARVLGTNISPSKLFDTLMKLALKGDSDCGGLMAYGYHSGEHITGFSEGRPLFVRSPESNFTLENFIRTQLFTSLCALRTGLNILFDEEKVVVDEIRGHGGFFKTEGVGEKIMAAATGVPVSVLATAGEGGAWGIALLASFMTREDQSLSLPDFLSRVFSTSMGEAVSPDPADVEGFQKFFEHYHQGLAVEQAAVDNLK
ncbi:MAG: ATPase [Spirochaetales bacterium]|nr:ATPase [Spirochaetales bacterium]